MKAIIYDSASGPCLKEVPVPSISDSEILIAVDACGLCGTDTMKIDTKPSTAILGHEIAGRIAKIGSKVRGFKEGDRVISAHHVPCGLCHYCLRGSVSMCRQFKSTNVDPCGFAEFVRLSELHVKNVLLKIPQGLDSLSASQTEPLACCLRNVKRLKLQKGNAVGIIGLGAIGLLTAQLCRHFGAQVFGLDIDKERAAGGKGYSDSALMEKAFMAATAGRGLDALVVAAGPATAAGEKLRWLRDGGTLNIFASFHPSQANIDLNQIYHRELTVMSSYSPALEDLAQSLALIAAGSIDISVLKPLKFALEEFDQALLAVRERKTLKAILVPAVKVA